MSNKALIEAFDSQWKDLKSGLKSVQAQVSQAKRQERAEVAASVPVYDAVVDLPAAGQLGRLAAVTATSKLYFDNGSTWKEVTLA